MIRFALVGCGRIAKRHSELLGDGVIGGAELTCVCDLLIEKAQMIGLKFGVPYYSDMHEMMRSNKVDVVVVLTESGNHAENVLDLCKYGADIIVEKPMALSTLDADRMIEACDMVGIKLFVVKQNRFNVPVAKVREALEAGRFGKLFLGTVRVRWCRPQEYYDQDEWRGTWAMDGGVLTNQASHHIDLLEWMMGDVESVFAKSVTASVNIEAEDTAVVLLKFRSGAIGIIEATTAVRPRDLEGSLSLMGETGSVEIGGFAVNEMKHWNFVSAEEGDSEVLAKYSVNPPNVYGFGHQSYYEHVVDCLTNGTEILVGGKQGRKSLAVITAIYDSIVSGSEVDVGRTLGLSRLGSKS